VPKPDNQRGSRGQEENTDAEHRPQRSNSIVDAAYSAAMFSDRGDKCAAEEEPAEAECDAGQASAR
jgi:hypothetical protein